MAKPTMTSREVLVAKYMELRSEIRSFENEMEERAPGLLAKIRSLLNEEVDEEVDRPEPVEALGAPAAVTFDDWDADGLLASLKDKEAEL